MKKTIFFLILILVSLNSFAAKTVANPFYNTTQHADENQDDQKVTEVKEQSAFYKKIGSIQKRYNQKISELLIEYKDGKSITVLLIVLLFSFVYGSVHALTPGHGKNIIAAWIITSHRKIWKLLFTSLLGMILHVGTATSMVYFIWYILKGRLSVQSPIFMKWFSIVAFLIICFVAFRNLVQVAISIFKARKAANNCEDNHSHSHGLENIKEDTSIWECITTAFMMGVVPCPVSTIMVMFMIAQGLLVEALFVGLAFALGMAFVLFTYSMILLIFRSFFMRFKTNSSGRFLDYGLQIFSALLLIFSSIVILSPYLV